MKTATLQFKSSAVQLEAKNMALCFHQVFFFFSFFFWWENILWELWWMSVTMGNLQSVFLFAADSTDNKLIERTAHKKTKKKQNKNLRKHFSGHVSWSHTLSRASHAACMSLCTCMSVSVGPLYWYILQFAHCLWPLLLISPTSCFWSSQGELRRDQWAICFLCVCVCVCVLMPAGDSYVSSREQSDHAHRNL